MSLLVITDLPKLEAVGGFLVDSPIPDSVFNAETECYDLVEIPAKKLVLPNGFTFDLWEDDGKRISVLFSPEHQTVEFQYLRAWLSTGFVQHHYVK
jgi:hypothetical protein